MQQQQKSEGVNLVVQGRYVWGQLIAQHKKNYTTKKPEFDQQNQPVMETAFGIAIPKPGPQSTPEEVKNFQDVWQAIYGEAGKQGYDHTRKDFAWKFDDGDTLKPDNTPYPAHYKGCIVIACSTRIPVKLFAWNQAGAIEAVTEKDIKCGDYVQVSLNIKGHPAPNAGLYINPSMVARFAFGEAIVGSADPNTVFTQRPSMPAGASATPIGTAPQYGMGQQAPAPAAPANFAPQMPNMGQQQQYPPQGQQMQGAPQVPNYQPNTQVLPPQMQQQMQQQPMGNYPPAAPGMPQNAGYSQTPPHHGGQPMNGQAAPTAYPSNGAPLVPNYPQYPQQ